MASVHVQISSSSDAAADAFFDLDAIEQEAGLGLLPTAAPEATTGIVSGAATSATVSAFGTSRGTTICTADATMTTVLSTPKKCPPTHTHTHNANNNTGTTGSETPSRALSTAIDMTSPFITALAILNSATKDEAATASASGIGPVQWSPARLSTGLGFASLFGGHAGGSTDLSSPTGGGGLPSLLSPTSTFAHAGAYTISPDEPVIAYAPTGLPYTPATTSFPTATSTDFATSADIARHAQALGSPWGNTALLEVAASENASNGISSSSSTLGAGGYIDPDQSSSANQIQTKKRRRSTGNRKRPKITISASALTAATATAAANIGTHLPSPASATSFDSDNDSDSSYDDPTNDAVSAIAAASAALSSGRSTGRSRPSTTTSSCTGRRALLLAASGKARTPAQIAGVERRKQTMARIREEQDRLEALGLSPKEIDRRVQKLRDELTEERKRLQLERNAAARAQPQPRASLGGGSKSKKTKTKKKTQKRGSGGSRKVDSKSLSWTTPSQQQQPRLPPIALSLSSTAGSVTLPESQTTRSGRVSVKRSFGEDFHDNIDDASIDDASDDTDEELDVEFIAGLPLEQDVEQAFDGPIESPPKSMNELDASRGDMCGSNSNDRGIGSNVDVLRFVTPITPITPKSTSVMIPFSSSIESTGGIGQATINAPVSTARGMAAKQNFSSYPPSPHPRLRPRAGSVPQRSRLPSPPSDTASGGQSSAAASKKRHRSNSKGLGGGRGAWTDEEDELFSRATEMYGNSWRKVAASVRSRTAAQCKSHNQKIQMRRLTD